MTLSKHESDDIDVLMHFYLHNILESYFCFLLLKRSKMIVMKIIFSLLTMKLFADKKVCLDIN